MRFFIFLTLFFFFGILHAQNVFLPKVWGKDSITNHAACSDCQNAGFEVLPVNKKIVQYDREFLFYWVMGLVSLLGIIKVFFGKYLENLLKVLLNSTLRQSQLMDQMIQSRRPSFYLNLLFVLSFSTLLTLITAFIMNRPAEMRLFAVCISMILAIYFFKSVIVRILGWLTGFRKEVRAYLFMLWLMNKGIGIICLPWILLLAFSDINNPLITVYAPLISIFLLIALRYVRTYARIQYDISMKPLHMLLYLLTVEVIPALLIFKCFTDFVIKKQ